MYVSIYTKACSEHSLCENLDGRQNFFEGLCLGFKCGLIFKWMPKLH